MELSSWVHVHSHILQLEQEGLVTRTFRRLDPERQQAILLAILDQAADCGPGAVHVKQVAGRAGVSVGALYTYFPNREAMLAFAVQVCVRFVTDSFHQYRSLLAAMPLREALSAYLAGGLEWSSMHRGMLRLFARAAYQGDEELADSLVKPVATVLRAMVHDILVAAASRGEIGQDVDLEAAERVVHALTVAVGDSLLLHHLNRYLQVTDDRVSPERAVRAAVDLILDGLSPNPEEEYNG